MFDPINYKDTLNLPTTHFPLRVSLPELESHISKFWQSIDLYEKISEKNKGRPKFILHDGPPYPNGDLHMGHALNKILKDIVLRMQRLQGKDTPFIPGWDCHGLPIEWKIEEKYRAQKKDKNQVPIIEFRQECRDFSKGWVNIQKEQFQSLGVMADWKNPYLTMTPMAEANIVEEIHKILEKGLIYKGFKPVQWSVVEQTALAEAEVEYMEKTSPSIYVLFPIVSHTPILPTNTHAVIWTTTPWTLPANRAIAYGPDLKYVVIKTSSTPHLLLMAENQVDLVIKACGLQNVEIIQYVQANDLEGLKAHHPLHDQGYDFEVPFLPADHVVEGQGTGLVHTAPTHGIEDFHLGIKYNLEIPQLFGGDGIYYTHVPLFGGQHIFKAQQNIVDALDNHRFLLGKQTIKHSYPHSWRSKAPLIYRTTPQWFMAMDKEVSFGPSEAPQTLREKALKNINTVTWLPDHGKNRIRSMVENRPDWCLSRQRTWGVPIASFVSKETGEVLIDPEVNARIVSIFQQEGSDVWFSKPAQNFLGEKYQASQYDQIKDIVDVWFESGTTHAFVLENNSNLGWPADLYLEGSDQHRGWFQSSLLESTATRGLAPYKSVMTHGFIVDEKGRKMSKSDGNTVDLKDILKQFGADILRLWVIGSDYYDDLKIGQQVLKHQEDIYRKIRNTLRFLLGNLKESHLNLNPSLQNLPELERWVLHRLHELDQSFHKKGQYHEFHEVFMGIYNFCVSDLSAFYFDIRKDVLYCDDQEGPQANATRRTLEIVFYYLSKWLVPFLPFTMEEAWQMRHSQADSILPIDLGFTVTTTSIHLKNFESCPKEWSNDLLNSKWIYIRNIRRAVTGAIEEKRNKGLIGSSLQAHVTINLEEKVEGLKDLNWPEILITSSAEIIETKSKAASASYTLDDIPNLVIQVSKATGEKCIRCWKIIMLIHAETQLCDRCTDVVHKQL